MYILAIDAGTTNSRALLINQKGEITGVEGQPFIQHYPNHGWVEHNPQELWQTQKEVIHRLLGKSRVSVQEIAAIGITNQRETVILWDRKSGEPIGNAIVWSDRRTSDWCLAMKPKYEKVLREKTGLFLEPYFSLSKIVWMLDNIPGVREKAEAGELCVGTVNTYLLWQLTGGKQFLTDVSNASRTLLFNIHTLAWDPEILAAFNIPLSLLPEVRSNSEVYGVTSSDLFGREIPIASMVGDQQAALFGHGCFHMGDTKCTYGTGSFILMNRGTYFTPTSHLTTVAWQIGKRAVVYALEGVVYSSGSVIEWLCNGLQVIHTPPEVEELAKSVPDSGGIYFVPAFHGLASPSWNSKVRATILGISQSATKAHIVRAALEGVAHQVTDVILSMQSDIKSHISLVKCGGGMSKSSFLMQMQANLLSIPLKCAQSSENTGLGAGYLAGLAVGFWKDEEEIASLWKEAGHYKPSMDPKDVAKMRKSWLLAIEAAKLWAKNEG
ncbi:MAG: glycerol kinase GlpK [Verrucomicrobia bacterium]|nr:glycerol kinase GlpK [Verrucomicrobiota bacterium]